MTNQSQYKTHNAFFALIISGFLLVALFGVAPHQAHALKLADVLDPGGLFHDGGILPSLPGFGNGGDTTNNTTINNTTNSNNVNSNINSPQNLYGYGGTSVVYYPNPTYPTTPTATPLNASCSANNRNIVVGQSASWIASVWGGTGAYSYNWQGDEGLSGGSPTVTKTYFTPGVKAATLTVSSGNQTISRTCQNTIFVENNAPIYDVPPVYYPPTYYPPVYYPPTQTYPSLQVSCSPNVSTARANDTVTWTAYVSGGSGYYTYNWTGTDSLYGSYNSTSRTYSSIGQKTAVVTVTSGSQTVARACSTSVYITDAYYNNNLTVSCYGTPSTAAVGYYITWYATATGGNGYYTYSWRGTDNLYGTNSSQYFAYNNPGNKYGTVTVSSGNQVITRDCNNAVQIGGAYGGYSPAVLKVSCSADTPAVKVDRELSWVGIVSGGTGAYSYAWTGTEGLYGSSRNITVSYDATGRKYATLTVVSGAEAVSKACTNSVLVGAVTSPIVKKPTKPTVAAKPLDGSCTANTASAKTSDMILWTATATGGKAATPTFVWNGSDSLTGSGPVITKSYSNGGGKTAFVTITSGTETITRPCTNGVAIEEVKSNFSAASIFSFTGPFGIFAIIVIIILLAMIFALYKRTVPPKTN